MLCGLQYFMYSCAIALLIQHSHSVIKIITLILLIECKITEDQPPGHAYRCEISNTNFQCFSFIVQPIYTGFEINCHSLANLATKFY